MKQLYKSLLTLRRSLLVGAAALLLGGCIEDDMTKSAMQGDMVPITLTVGPTTASTRTTTLDDQTSQIASGQTFYAYFTSSNVVPQSTTYTANGSGGATPATQPYFKFSETTTDVHAYYPSSVTEGTTGFTVQADQSLLDNYRLSDLMFASVTIPKASPSGVLTFDHKMAKVRVNVTVNAGVSIQSVKLKGIKRKVTFAPATGAVSSPVVDGSTDITLYTHAGQTANFNCVALVPPQDVAASTNLISVTTSNHTLVYQLPSAVSFQSGTQYVYNVSVFDTQLVVSTSITAWDTTPTAQSGQGSLNRPKLPIEYIAPYNMQTATQMATDNLRSHSAYITWNSSGLNETGAGQGPKANVQAMINGTAVAGYHLPTKAEWCSVIAPNFGSSDDSAMGGDNNVRITYNIGQHTGLTETVAWGVANYNGTYSYAVNRVFSNDYDCPSTSTIGYGLRFKELDGSNGQYTCAYRYHYQASDASLDGGASLTVMVKYVGTDASVTIDVINKESWWSSPEYTVVLPACGTNMWANNSDQPAGWDSPVSPENGNYWAADAKNDDKVWLMYFSGGTLYGNIWSEPSYAHSIRLFKDFDPSENTLVTASDVGKVLGANGQVYTTVSEATSAGTTASGIIAYAGDAGSVETGTSYRCLVIGLTDANSGALCTFHADNNNSCVNLTSDAAVAITYVNGLASTNTLLSDGHTHTAATVANSYGTDRPVGASVWFLPSPGQWNLMMKGLASKKAGSSVTENLSVSNNNTFKSSNINSVITDAGGTGFKTDHYWLSAYNNTGIPWFMSFSYGRIYRDWGTHEYYVRAVFAY